MIEIKDPTARREMLMIAYRYERLALHARRIASRIAEKQT
jgi:hypothetical protein